MGKSELEEEIEERPNLLTRTHATKMHTKI